MTIFKIGTGDLGGSGGVNLLDRTKYNTVVGDDSNEIQRDVSPLCDAPCSPTGSTALLKKSRVLYIKRPMTIYCSAVGYQEALNGANAIIDVVNDARSHNLGVACDNTSGSTAPDQYMVLRIGNQTLPSVWTILDGDVSFTRREISSLWIIVLKVELLLMNGAAFLDGSGFPASGTNPMSLPM